MKVIRLILPVLLLASAGFAQGLIATETACDRVLDVFTGEVRPNLPALLADSFIGTDHKWSGPIWRFSLRSATR